MSEQTVKWEAHLSIAKWDPETIRQAREDLGLVKPQAAELLLAGVLPERVEDYPGNAALTAGLARLLDLFIGAGGQAMNNTHCRVGAGDGSTAVVIGDTDLSAAAGSTHRWFNMADATYPSRATNVITIVSTFASADGNFAWSEWGVDLGTASSNAVTAPLVNRKVQAMGTKVSGAVWVPTVTITVS